MVVQPPISSRDGGAAVAEYRQVHQSPSELGGSHESSGLPVLRPLYFELELACVVSCTELRDVSTLVSQLLIFTPR